MLQHQILSLVAGQFTIQKVSPQASGECSKVKVKVRVNVHGIFSVSSASLVEVLKTAEGEEPMETDNTPKEEEVTLSCYLKIYNIFLTVDDSPQKYALC